MLTDVDAMLSDAAILPTTDFLKNREIPAILTPECYKAAMTRVAASRLLRRAPIENFRNRLHKVNKLLRRDSDR